MGSGRRGGGREAAGLGRPAPHVAAAGRRDRRRCAASCDDAGIDHVVLCGMGGSSLAPEVICATYGVELTVLDSSQPRPGPRGARRPARAHRRRGVQQVRLAPSRPTASGAPTSRRSPTPASTRRRGSSSSPTRAPRSTSRPARGGLPRRQRRPRRRRPLLRADRVRPGAERAGRRRHRDAARRGRGGRRPAGRRRRGQPRRCGSAPRWPAPARCATSWCSSTRAPGSSGSPTGPSS